MRLDHLLSREQGEAERRSLQTEVDLPEKAERTGRRDGRTGETLLERQVVLKKLIPYRFQDLRKGKPERRDKTRLRILTTAQGRKESRRPVKVGREDFINRNVGLRIRKSSEEEHRVDARAPNAEEGRGQLRKAAGSRKQTLIRRYPNGETQLRIAQLPPPEYIGRPEGTRGTETSKYPEEKKETSISKVAASEMERAQTGEHAFRGCGSA